MSMAPCSLLESANITTPEMGEDEISRRSFIKAAGIVSAAVATGIPQFTSAEARAAAATSTSQLITIVLKVNGKTEPLTLDTRTSLLDVLRDNLDLTGSKKGCDHGQCGACTVLLDGRRINSCLTLAAAAEGAEIITVEGLAKGDKLHPVQESFLEHDGYQCGYCTPGQICSTVALIYEVKRGELSRVSYETDSVSKNISDDEIRERMSGNICRCGAYPNIVSAVRAVLGGPA